jgi:menaquinone-specific isochorismate synthase
VTIVPLDPLADASPAALGGFLAQCQAAAKARGVPQLASISLEVSALDPLAVLESIFEPAERHFYAERPSEGVAVAGAEAVAEFTASGPGRFAACQAFVEKTLENSFVVGDLKLPFAGPTFFAAFCFADEAAADEPFQPATVFVPRWQVAQAQGRTVAVANLLIEATTPLALVAEKVLRAHAKFGRFNYQSADFSEEPAPSSFTGSEVGAHDAYVRSVARAVERIGRGEFSKVVLARAKELTSASALHPLRVLNSLRQRYPDCYAFSVANGKGTSFIGASPEQLASVSDGTLVTEALAGSARRGQSAREDAALAAGLLASDKDLREQRIVLETIVGKLKRLGLEASHPGTPVIRRLANVQHLQTPIQVALPKETSLLKVVEQLHPTPAVGGLPLEPALAAIAELEQFPRGLYAGAIGWIEANGGGQFFVGLRSALIAGKTARLYAGAGIVAGSSPEKEFAETELKFRAIQEAILS